MNYQALDRPVNDQCSTANAASLPYTAFENTEGAYPSITDLECNLSSDSRAVWHSYTPPADIEGQIVSASVDETEFDTYFSFFTGSCEDLQCIYSDGPYRFSDVGAEFSARRGNQYYVAIHGENFEAGNYGMRWEVSFDFKARSRYRPSYPQMFSSHQGFQSNVRVFRDP